MYPTPEDQVDALRELGLTRRARQDVWWKPETTQETKNALQTAVDIANMRVAWIADRMIVAEIEAAEELARKAAAEKPNIE